MASFKFFHATKYSEENTQKEKECLARIKNLISKKSGIDVFLYFSDCAIAFAGSNDHMELMLELCTQMCNGKNYLYASVDDEVSWQEWDYKTIDEFENTIAEYISTRINRTIKTVIEKEKHKSLMVSVYYLDEITNEWILIESNKTENKLICRFAARKTETTEEIKTYRLEV